MGKESKNLGQTKACPECKKTLIKSANIIGQGAFKTKCPYCNSLILVEVGQKSFITLSKIKVVIIIALAIGVYQVVTLTSLRNAFMAMIQNNEIKVTK